MTTIKYSEIVVTFEKAIVESLFRKDSATMNDTIKRSDINCIVLIRFWLILVESYVLYFLKMWMLFIAFELLTKEGCGW